MWKVKMLADSINNHVVGIHLTIGRITRDMGGTDEHLVEQCRIHMGLVFPDIDDGITHAFILQSMKQGMVVNHLAPTGVNNIRYAREVMEEVVIGQMPCDISSLAGQWYVEGYDVALSLDFVKRNEAVGY